MPSQDLASFAKNNKKFIKLKDGESITAEFVKYTVAISRFDADKEVVIYWLKPEGSEKALTWENTSTRVAEEFSKIAPGSGVKITRIGSTAKDTKYKIEPVVGF